MVSPTTLARRVSRLVTGLRHNDAIRSPLEVQSAISVEVFEGRSFLCQCSNFGTVVEYTAIIL